MTRHEVTWNDMARIVAEFLKDDTPPELEYQLLRMGEIAQAYVLTQPYWHSRKMTPEPPDLTDEEVLQELVDRVEVD
jgi:hypothetical protein